MALYEYECKKCSNRFEVRRSYTDESAVSCPSCKGQGQRIFSPISAIFNGPGFYTTDSRSPNPATGSCGDTPRSFG